MFQEQSIRAWMTGAWLDDEQNPELRYLKPSNGWHAPQNKSKNG